MDHARIAKRGFAQPLVDLTKRNELDILDLLGTRSASSDDEMA